MKITDGEKLILLMLSEIYERLEVNGNIEPKFIREAIFSNNLWAFSWKYSGIPFEDQEDPDVVKDVVEILGMWSFIEYSYKQLSNEEKAKLEEELGIIGKNPMFRGFDGNNESEYMGTASFIVNELERFEEFKGRDFNSHCPSIDGYKRMLAVYMGIRKNLEFGKLLTIDNIAEILSERIHPSNR